MSIFNLLRYFGFLVISIMFGYLIALLLGTNQKMWDLLPSALFMLATKLINSHLLPIGNNAHFVGFWIFSSVIILVGLAAISAAQRRR